LSYPDLSERIRKAVAGGWEILDRRYVVTTVKKLRKLTGQSIKIILECHGFAFHNSKSTFEHGRARSLVVNSKWL
jgi:hypothetical protein